MSWREGEERRAFLVSKWEALEREEKLLEEGRCELAKSWRDVEKRQQDLKKKQDAFEKKVGDLDFVLDGAQQVKLNVGGQIFEIAAKHLIVDRFSLLANVCRKEPVIEVGEDGSFFFDRDWWIFRHIYLFLLDGTLPTSVATLRELYYEATFYRLSLLRYAIETRILADKERKEHEAEAHARMGAMGARRSMGSPQVGGASTAIEAGVAMRAGAAYGGVPSYYDRPSELGMPSGHALGCAGSAAGGSGLYGGTSGLRPGSQYAAPLPDPHGFTASF